MIILASKSPRRKELLEKHKIDFIVDTPLVDEDIIESDVYKYAMKTAHKKANALFNKYPNDIIVSADTIVVVNNMILEKPKDKDDCIRMIKLLQNNVHKVITGCFVGNINNSNIFYDETKVFVKEISYEEILEYANTSEPYDKAGAYAIQGLFNKYIDHIEGSYENVVGLPVDKIIEKINEVK